jgi:phosphate ABC transporter permease protein PstC/phosphate ABC transporter permease subunit PstA
VVLLRWLGRLFHATTFLVALGILGIVAGILAVLLQSSWSSIVSAGPAFLTRQVWNPTNDVYGALPAIYGTLLTSGIALLLAVPVALGVAVFLSEIAPPRLREPLAAVVDLSAAIPSVVWGLWGVLVLAPLMKSTVEPALARTTGGTLLFSGTPGGYDFLTAGVVLAAMVLPTITAVSRAALQAVPRIQREAALSLGATRTEATRLAVLGPARAGIFGGVLLGLGRALGEAIAVTMVIGNIYAVPTSLYAPGQTIASLIAQSFLAGVGPAQRSALVELGLVLFLIALGVNVIARLLLARAESGARGAGTARRGLLHPRGRGHRWALAPRPGEAGDWRARALPDQARRRRRRAWTHRVVMGLTLLALVIAIAPLASVVYNAAVQGGPAVLTPSFYVAAPPPSCNPRPGVSCPIGGIGPEIEGTLILLGMASLIAVPVGVLAGIYLAEYGRHRFATVVSFFADVMTGFPSILLGLFVWVVFLDAYPQLVFSAYSGAVALSLLMIPIVTRASEIALRAVPTSLRESALALGFPRHRVTLRVVLGNARNGLVTGVLLAVARAGGETAVLIMTAFGSPYPFNVLTGWSQPTGALPLFIFNSLLAGGANLQEDAWGAALVLIAIMLAVSLASRYALRPRTAGVEGA